MSVLRGSKPGSMARMAVSVIVMHEWMSVPRHQGRPMPADSFHKLDFLGLGMREYGARQGIWRLLDVLDRNDDVKATILTSGLIGELFPDSIRLRKSAATRLHRTIGTRRSTHRPSSRVPTSEHCWRSPRRCSKGRAVGQSLGTCRRVLAQRRIPWELIAELGFRWTADYVSSDVPQLLNVNRRRIISLGYAPPGCNDGDLISHSLGEALADAKYTFDAMYA